MELAEKSLCSVLLGDKQNCYIDDTRVDERYKGCVMFVTLLEMMT